jgi:hypothetical protein
MIAVERGLLPAPYANQHHLDCGDAHSASELGQPATRPKRPLCQLSPATDIAAHRGLDRRYLVTHDPLRTCAVEDCCSPILCQPHFAYRFAIARHWSGKSNPCAGAATNQPSSPAYEPGADKSVAFQSNFQGFFSIHGLALDERVSIPAATIRTSAVVRRWRDPSEIINWGRHGTHARCINGIERQYSCCFGLRELRHCGQPLQFVDLWRRRASFLPWLNLERA